MKQLEISYFKRFFTLLSLSAWPVQPLDAGNPGILKLKCKRAIFTKNTMSIQALMSIIEKYGCIFSDYILMKE